MGATVTVNGSSFAGVRRWDRVSIAGGAREEMEDDLYRSVSDG